MKIKSTVLIFTFLMFLSCNEKEKESNFSSSTIKDINEIVETIIVQDSLSVFKSDESLKSFCMDLIKININVPIKGENQLLPPIPFNNISVNRLLNLKIEKESFFLSTDSTYLISQNPGQKTFSIEQDIVAKINLTTIEKESSKRKKGKRYSFYEMTIPLFSKDNTKAYVELNYYCGSLCGSGKAILLSKTNGKWRIIDKYRTWVS